MAASVGNKSTPCTISSLTRPAGILPGQRIMNGTRMPPSHAVKYCPRHGPAQPSQGRTNSGPLSLAKITIVLSRIPSRFTASRRPPPLCSISASMSAQSPFPVFPGKCRIGQCRQVWLCQRHIGKERLCRLCLGLNERDGSSRDLGINEAALLQIVDLERSALLALPSFHDLLRRHHV